MYQEALKRLIIKGVIGFVMAGVPYGWELVGRVIGGFVVGHIAIMIVAFILRAAASMLIG